MGFLKRVIESCCMVSMCLFSVYSILDICGMKWMGICHSQHEQWSAIGCQPKVWHDKYGGDTQMQQIVYSNNSSIVIYLTKFIFNHFLCVFKVESREYVYFQWPNLNYILVTCIHSLIAYSYMHCLVKIRLLYCFYRFMWNTFTPWWTAPSNHGNDNALILETGSSMGKSLSAGSRDSC